jgi:hypothetical protein
VSDPVSTNTLNLIPSPPTTPTPTPTAPSSLSAVGGIANVALSWSASSSDGAITYTISRSTSSGSGFTVLAQGLTSTTYSDLTALNGTSYYYIVTAVNAGGSSAPSNEASARPISSFTITSAIVDNTAGPNALRVFWPAATGASSYTVKYGTSPGAYPVTASTSASSFHGYTITGLTPGTRYYIMVTATNAVGAGTSVNATAEVSGIPMSRPYFTSAISTSSSASLTWLGGIGSTQVNLFYGISPGVYSTAVSNAGSPYNITGLESSTEYYVMVSASNSSGHLDADTEITLNISDESDGPGSGATPTPAPAEGEIIATLHAPKGQKTTSLQDFTWYILFKQGLNSKSIPSVPTAASFSNCPETDCQASVGFRLTKVTDTTTEMKSLTNPSAGNMEFARIASAVEFSFPDSVYKLTVSSIGGKGLIKPLLDAAQILNANGDPYTTNPVFEQVAYTGGATAGASAVPALAFHASTAFGADGKASVVYVFGGKTPTGLSDKLYRFSKSTPSTWEEVVPINNGKPGETAVAPDARMGAYLANSGDFLILYGGTNADQSVSYSDLWKFNISESTWTELSPNLIHDSGVNFTSTFGSKIESSGQLSILGGLDEAGHSGPGVTMDLAGIALAETPRDLAGLIQPVYTNDGDFQLGSSTLDPNGNRIIASRFSSFASPSSTTLAYWDGSSVTPINVDAGSPVQNLIAPYGGILQTSGNFMYHLGGSAVLDIQAPDLSDVIFRIDVSNGSITLMRTVSGLAARMGSISFVNSDGNIILHGGLTETNSAFAPSSDLIEFNPALGSARNISGGSSTCECISLSVNPNFGNPASDGSILSPFEVCSTEQFKSMEAFIRTARTAFSRDPFAGKYIVQCVDLDLSDGTYTPIGTTSPFRGNYDGQGHTIQNMTLGSAGRPFVGSAGVFGTLLGATVENLKLSNLSLYGTYSGGLAGSSKTSTVRNIEVLDSVILGGTLGGGLIGSSTYDEVSDIKVSNTAITGLTAGGIIGSFRGTDSYQVLRTASSSNSIQGDKAGGIAGYLSGKIQESWVLGGSIRTSPGVGSFETVGNTNYTSFKAAGGLIGLGTGAILTDCAAYPTEISGTGILGLVAGGLNYSSALIRVLAGATLTDSNSLSPSAGYQESVGPNGESPTLPVHAYLWKTGTDSSGQSAVETLSPTSAPSMIGLHFSQITDLNSMSGMNPTETAISSSTWKNLTGSTPWLVPKNAPQP